MTTVEQAILICEARAWQVTPVTIDMVLAEQAEEVVIDEFTLEFPFCEEV